MDKQKALKLVGALAQASSKHALLANGYGRGSAAKAAEREEKVAR